LHEPNLAPCLLFFYMMIGLASSESIELSQQTPSPTINMALESYS
jgi:hypothetical protein